MRIGWWAAAIALIAVVAVSPRLHAQEPESGPGFVLQGEGGLVTALLLDPSTPSTIYAATARGLYRSIDSGANWEPRNRGLEGHSILALAVDPSSPARFTPRRDGGGVYKNPDGGHVWAAANFGLTSLYVGVIAVQSGVVYAGHRSWPHFPEHRLGRDVDRAHASDDASRRHCHCCRSAASRRPPRGHEQRRNLPEHRRRSDLDPHARSAEQGNHLVPPAIDPTKSTTVYATAHAGLFRSDDSGVTWKGLHKSLKSWNVLALAIDPGPEDPVRRDRDRDLQIDRHRQPLDDAEPGPLRQRAFPRSRGAFGGVCRHAPRRPQERGRRANWSPLRLAPDPNAPPPPAAATSSQGRRVRSVTIVGRRSADPPERKPRGSYGSAVAAETPGNSKRDIPPGVRGSRRQHHGPGHSTFRGDGQRFSKRSVPHPHDSDHARAGLLAHCGARAVDYRV